MGFNRQEFIGGIAPSIGNKIADLGGKSESNSGLLYPRELLRSKGIEIEAGSIQNNAEEIARLLCNPETIEHYAGIAPPDPKSGVNVRKYREKHPNYDILIATPEEVKQYYESRNLLVLTAKDHKKEDKPIIGMLTVEKMGLGVPGMTPSRLGVAPGYRGEHIATELLFAAHAFIFSDPKDGGFGLNHSRAAVILGVPGYEISLKTLIGLGYEPASQTPTDTTIGWDFPLGRFVDRRVIPLFLGKKGYLDSLKASKRFSERDMPIKTAA